MHFPEYACHPGHSHEQETALKPDVLQWPRITECQVRFRPRFLKPASKRYEENHFFANKLSRAGHDAHFLKTRHA